MRLNYDIIWFEDDDEFVKELKPVLKAGLRKIGLVLKLEHRDTIKDLDTYDFSSFDLILSDLNMSEDEDEENNEGEKLISEIRKQGILSEIYFYSQNSQDLSESVKNLSSEMSLIQRIGIHAGRKNLENKIVEFVKASIKKIEDPNNMRGLVIAQVIEMERIIKGCCENAICDPATQETPTSFGIMKDTIKNKKERFASSLENLCSCSEDAFSLGSMGDLLESSDKLKMLKRVLKKMKSRLNETDTEKANQIKSEAIDKLIIDTRNVLAHVKVETNANGRQILKSRNSRLEDIEIDSDWCIDVRNELLSYTDILNDIERICKENALT